VTQFERLTASPEALGEFLASIPVANSPWDECFSKTFCAGCDRDDCDTEPCPHQAERNNPTWWLMQKVEMRRTDVPAWTWEDGTNPQIICNHYGYADHETIQAGHHGYWPMDTVMERITLIPEFIQHEGLDKQKFRLVLDYDPEFPRAMARFQIERRTEHPSGGTPEEAKSSFRSQ